MNIVDSKLNFTTQLTKNNNTHENIIIHHALAKKCTVYDIHRWHKDKGFIGIGYHFFIAKNGTIYKGRNINWQGAHCAEDFMNIKSIGVCIEGCYEDYKNQTDKNVPEVQLKALKKLVKYLMDVYNISIDKVKKHGDYAKYKLCPGNYFPWNDFVKQLEEYKMNKEDAGKIISLLGTLYNFVISQTDKDEIHRLANELRKVSGQL